MHVILRPTQLAALLLATAAPLAGAESPMPEPIAPAVIGRPLDQIQVRPRPMPIKPGQVWASRPKEAVAAARKPVAKKPVAKKPAATVTARTAVPATARMGAAAAAKVAAPVVVAAAVPHAPAAPATAPAAKQAVDDRADPGVQVVDNVGQGSNLSRKRLAPGAYIGSRYQALVRKYYEAHPAKAKDAKWQIGEPVPPKAALTGVPDDLRATLPVVPPGHQYVQVDGEVVLLAVQSRMVVDGVSRSVR